MSLLYEGIAFDPLGKPVFIGPYNQIQIAQPPPVNFLLLVSNQWTNGIGMHRDQTVITDPDGAQFVETDEVDFFLRDPASAHRIDHRMAVTLTKDGRYRVSVLGNGQVKLEYFFFVRFRAAVSVETAPGAGG